MKNSRKVPELRNRIAGKTLPPEKFAIIKATKYIQEHELGHDHGDFLLPAFELFYIWNVYGNSAENPTILNPILDRIESKLRTLSKSSENDNYFILLLLKGVVLRNLRRSDEALELFNEILSSEDRIKTANYVAPHAAFELGMTFLDLGNCKDAKKWLTKARDDYSGFLVEALVHLRIHGAMSKLKLMSN